MEMNRRTALGLLGAAGATLALPGLASASVTPSVEGAWCLLKRCEKDNDPHTWTRQEHFATRKEAVRAFYAATKEAITKNERSFFRCVQPAEQLRYAVWLRLTRLEPINRQAEIQHYRISVDGTESDAAIKAEIGRSRNPHGLTTLTIRNASSGRLLFHLYDDSTGSYRYYIDVEGRSRQSDYCPPFVTLLCQGTDPTIREALLARLGRYGRI